MVAKIKEVAERSGLSTAMVSRILNGKGGHSTAAVKTVERIMEEMGFNANFNSPVPECVGIVMFSYRDFLLQDYTAALLTGIMEMLTNEGMIAQIIPMTPGRLSYQYIREIIDRYGLKGLIIQEFSQLYELSSHLSRLDIPVVFVGNTEMTFRHSICSDSYHAGRDAATYFWSLGHRRFGIISASEKDICQRLRIEGFLSVVKEMGSDPAEVWRKGYVNIDDSVTATAAELVNMEQPPTAIFSTNSTLSRKMLMEFRKMKFRVPDDCSIISFEEWGELDNLETPVTVIRQPTQKMGAAAVRMLIDLLRQRKIGESEIFRCSLVVRDTTLPLNIK